MGTGRSFPRGKEAGAEADRSLPSSTGVKNGGAIPRSPMRLHDMVLN
jgi:hypothetical protein